MAVLFHHCNRKVTRKKEIETGKEGNKEGRKREMDRGREEVSK